MPKNEEERKKIAEVRRIQFAIFEKKDLPISVYYEVLTHCRRLKENHPNHWQTELWHICVGGTVKPGECDIFFDFSDELSLYEFMINLRDKYNL
ncbi:MAG: hypothetical protein WC666_03190 [Candidatus Paceibacterota bacterium]|jgi:hypothetical protein